MTTAALRRHALSIFRAALAAANPADAVRRHLERVDVSRFRNVYVVGAGKAGASESPYHSTDFHADPSLVGGKEEDIQKTGHTSEQEKQASDAGKDQGSSAELEPLKPPAVISLDPPAPPEAPLVAALRALLEKRPAEAMII